MISPSRIRSIIVVFGMKNKNSVFRNYKLDGFFGSKR